MSLSVAEINNLMDALDAWEKAPAQDGMIQSIMTGVINSMTAGTDPTTAKEKMDKWKAEDQQAQVRAKVAVKLREEQALKLKVKLLEMRDAVLSQG